MPSNPNQNPSQQNPSQSQFGSKQNQPGQSGQSGQYGSKPNQTGQQSDTERKRPQNDDSERDNKKRAGSYQDE